MAVTDGVNCDCATGPQTRNFAQLREAVLRACGFIDATNATKENAQLQDMRARVHANMGYAAYSGYAPGMSDLIDGWLNQAAQMLARRIELGWTGADPLTAGTDTLDSTGAYGCDSRLVVTLATGIGKAHYGMKDAKLWFDMVEKAISDIATRRPPNAIDVVEESLRSSNRQIHLRYKAAHTERWFSWALTANVGKYGLYANAETADEKLDPLTIDWVGVQDVADQRWRPLVAGIPEGVNGQTVTGRPEAYEYKGCFRVWPVPANTSGSLLVKGHITPDSFGAGMTDAAKDTSVPSVDDELVFLMAVADVKAIFGQKDAQLYLGKFDMHIRGVVAGMHATNRYVPREGPNPVEWSDCPTPVYIESP